MVQEPKTYDFMTLLEPHSYMWEENAINIGSLSPKRDWGPNRVNTSKNKKESVHHLIGNKDEHIYDMNRTYLVLVPGIG